MLWDSRAFSVSSVSALVKETHEEKKSGREKESIGRVWGPTGGYTVAAEVGDGRIVFHRHTLY